MAAALKVGFIGAGGMARSHMKGVAALGDVSIAAICDLDAVRAGDAAEEHGAKPYTDYRAMLKTERLDAAYVILPPFAHGDVELAVIDRGLPFLVEKPVALSLDTAKRIRDAAARKNLVTSVGYQLRYMTSIQQAKALIGGRAPAMLVGHYWSAMIRGNWWQDLARSGGQVVEQATHIVDLMRYLGGDIVGVEARTAQRGGWNDPAITIPDVYVAGFAFANGAFGTLTTCCLLDEWTIGIDIMLREARLHWKIDELQVTPAKVAVPPAEQFPAGNIEAAFLNAVRGGDRAAILSPYEDAAKTLAVTLAVNESARKNAAVKVG